MNSFSFTLSLPVVREPASKIPVRTPEETYRQLKDIAALAQEVFCVVTLTRRYTVLDRHLITVGILDASLVHPREVFRPAILDCAAAILLAHNHPSGDPTPSAEDIRITRQIVDAGKILQIDVLDHVVIGRDDVRPFISLRESGLVSFGG